MAKKRKAESIRSLVLKNGQTLEILSETGKYYVCRGTQFRKANGMILRTEELAEEKKEDVKDAEDE